MDYGHKRGKRIEIARFQDKRQITAVVCGTLMGEILPFQLIYVGKTIKCLPKYNFPSDWQVTHTPKHWLDEDTMLQYLNKMIALFVKSTCKELL